MLHGPITSNGREATVTERAARSNPQRAVGEAHCELCVTQKVIDAHLKALSTPWWTESSIFHPLIFRPLIFHPLIFHPLIFRPLIFHPFDFPPF